MAFMNADVGEGFVFGIESDVKNFQTFAKTGTDYAIQYPDGAIEDGNSDPSGTHYGVIIAIRTALSPSLIGSGLPIVADSSAVPRGVVAENEAGKITVAGGAVSVGDYFDDVARDYIFAFAGDGLNDFSQIYVNGTKDGEVTAAGATFPTALPKQTPINTQVLNGVYGIVYLDEPISSYDELEALARRYIGKT